VINIEINNIYHGNCIELLRELEDNSIDSIVTDPPYELGFMGKKWDSTGIAYNVEMWKECLRVLKPGGHLLSFGGSRTYHRMACTIEDAGFEIRDQIMWIYGSGFPKSYDISKGIDKKFGAKREVVGKRVHPTLKNKPNIKSRAYHVETLNSNENMESWDITAPATNEAKQWSGWGTALKPAHEPIVVARKPLSEKNVVDNVLKWGTGGINIDACRIETNEDLTRNCMGLASSSNEGWKRPWHEKAIKQVFESTNGRFPANIIFDEEAKRLLDEQSGITRSTKVKNKKKSYDGESFTGMLRGISTPDIQYNDVGGASRFFYCAKASRKERGEGNNHPTVKPIALMKYLIKLVMPPNGIVLDPFAGSGTTLVAAKKLGFNYIGFEIEEQYIEIINKRLSTIP
jgi:site-specific DNA-methyltransferase (adenine-specific)